MRSWRASTATFDWSETHTGLKATRNAAMREALAAWLAAREPHYGLAPPAAAAPMERPAERQRFHEAYHSILKFF